MTPLSADLLQRLQRWRLVGLMAAIAGGVACAAGWFATPERFYSAWLTAFLYWLGMSLGCLSMALLHGLTGGGWGRTLRRVLEAGYQTLPLPLLLFVPLWLGVREIYVWTNVDYVQQHEALVRKAAFLTIPGYRLRSAHYFMAWILSAWIITLLSPDEERALETRRSRRLQQHSGMCMILYCYAMTFASVDWMMSLEPEWYSTMYGLLQLAGQAVAGLSCGVLVVTALREFDPWRRIVTAERLHDIGNLLLAGVMFWAYCAFFQFLVIWQGNLPEENVWYVHRFHRGWQFPALLLLGLHFSVPFLLLLSRKQKRQATHLVRIAALLLVMRYIDLYWTIVPAFAQSESLASALTSCWLDLAAFVAMGGAWCALFTWRLSVRASLPLYDPEHGTATDERAGCPVVA